MPSIEFVHVGVSAMCPGGVSSLNLCIVFVLVGVGGGCLPHCPLLYVVIGIVFVGFVPHG